MSSGFNIPIEQAPKDPRTLAAMIHFLNDVNADFDFSATEQLWEERGFPADILGNLGKNTLTILGGVQPICTEEQ